jgi:hypothetical protein
MKLGSSPGSSAVRPVATGTKVSAGGPDRARLGAHHHHRAVGMSDALLRDRSQKKTYKPPCPREPTTSIDARVVAPMSASAAEPSNRAAWRKPGCQLTADRRRSARSFRRQASRSRRTALGSWVRKRDRVLGLISGAASGSCCVRWERAGRSREAIPRDLWGPRSRLELPHHPSPGGQFGVLA